MDKAKIIEKLELLTGLIDKTEPDIPSDKALFSHHIIKNQENIKHIRDIIKGNMLVDEDTQDENIIMIMKDSNRFWKIRNMILSAPWAPFALCSLPFLLSSSPIYPSIYLVSLLGLPLLGSSYVGTQKNDWSRKRETAMGTKRRTRFTHIQDSLPSYEAEPTQEVENAPALLSASGLTSSLKGPFPPHAALRRAGSSRASFRRSPIRPRGWSRTGWRARARSG